MSAETKIVFPNTSALIAAEAPDFPSFLFSERELHKAVKVFKKGFDGLLTYAVKCNPSPHILDQLHKEGLKAFDVASNVEMELVRDHCPGAVMHYNNPIKNKREIARAYEEFGVRSFTIDHPQQLDQLAAIVAPSRDIEVTTRFKAGKALKSYDFGIKFGVMQDGAAEIVQLVEQMGYTPSLCFHVGSQCEDAYAYERHIAAAAKIAEESGIELKRLNIGGGYPAPYPTSEAPPMDYYFETIETAVKDNFGKSRPELIIEPGRAMVTSSTSLLLRVKHQRGGVSVYLNDGAYGALMEVKFMHFTPPVRVWRGPRIHDNDGNFEDFTVWGPTCDSYDVLPQIFTLPSDIDEDDWIEFGLMGAYTQASLTPFNGFDRRDQYWVDQILGAEDEWRPRSCGNPRLRLSEASPKNLEDAMLALTDFGRRIMICGPSNSGKSTLAVAIGHKLGLPALHIDQFRHLPNTDWVQRPDAEFYRLHDEAILGDDWVMEGNYTKLMPQRLARATGIILLGDNRWANLWRYFRRSLTQPNRPGGLDGTRDSIKWEMIRWIVVVSPKNLRRYRTDLPATGLPFVELHSMAELRRVYGEWALVRPATSR